jgi:hypothetical protein
MRTATAASGDTHPIYASEGELAPLQQCRTMESVLDSSRTRTVRLSHKCTCSGSISGSILLALLFHDAFEVMLLSGRRWRACALATVRRSNCTCGFPACSFHEDSGP